MNHQGKSKQVRVLGTAQVIKGDEGIKHCLLHKGVASGLCETLRDSETSVFHGEPETFIYFEMRVRDFGVILKNASPRIV